jgi:flagellum-specific peptidoglycan hydrolase FlgJ
MVSNAHQEGFKEALGEPIETELLVLDSLEDTFSQEALVEEIKKLNIRFPHIVLAQSILETGYWESRIYQENHNLFGMKQARARATTANGTQLGHAFYDDWKESVTDYALYQAAYLNKLRTEKKYLNYLDKNYAEAKNYDKALIEIIERHNLKELFLD